MPHAQRPVLASRRYLQSTAIARCGLGAAALFTYGSLSAPAAAQTKKPFEEYLKPTPIVAPLSSASWGVAGVLPRDLSNGIESAKGAAVPPDYYYWDGEIIKAMDGKYHMFMSTWADSAGGAGFQGWTNSDAFHAISQTDVLGPYVRQDYVYNNNGSHKGHNVSAVQLPDGTLCGGAADSPCYAVVVSEIVPFAIYTSNSLDGPWKGCTPNSQVGGSNISLFPRHDGRFQIVERNGTIAISDTLCGTYAKQHPTCSYTQNATDSIYPKRTSIPGVPNPTYAYEEDPHIWRSGGTYHVIYSGSGDRVGWHVYSPDGLSWYDNGYAWSPRDYQKIFCYEGSTTCTQWYKMERPGVVLEDGHPTHITWAVADVDKDTQIPAGSNHGSKVVVVPFDGVAFDNDFGDAGTGGTDAGGGSGSSSGSSSRDGGVEGSAGDAAVANDSGGASGSSGSSSGGSGSGSSSGSGSGQPTSGSGSGSGSSGSAGSGASSGSSSGSSSSGSSSGATGSSGASGAGAGQGDAGGPSDSNSSSGCGCLLAASEPGAAGGAGFSVMGALLGLRIRRRRHRNRVG